MFQWYPTWGEANKAWGEGVTTDSEHNAEFTGQKNTRQNSWDKEETVQDNLATVRKQLWLGRT